MKSTRLQMYKERKEIEHSANKNEVEPTEIPAIAPEDLAKVRYSIGVTINLENFNSARVDIGVELPSHLESLEATYEEAVDYCNDKLVEEISQLQNLRKVLK